MKKISAGIDIGTTHAKAVILDESGLLITQFKAAYIPIQDENGMHELNPQDIEEAVMKMLSKCFDEFREIHVVCFSAAMHGIMAIDSNNNPLSNFITWADTRSKYESLECKEEGKATPLYEQTGTPVHPMSPMIKISWWRKTFPEKFNLTAKFISFKEYIIFKLTGSFYIDHSIAAATGLFNVHQFTWNEDSLAYSGITKEMLSQLVPVDFRIPQPIKAFEHCKNFIIGGSDGAMANIGSNAMAEGIASLTIGTSAAIRTIVSNPVIDPKARLFCYALNENQFICGGPINNGAVAIQWFIEKILQQQNLSAAAYDLQISKVFSSHRPSGLLFLPHLMGERAINWDPFAQGAFVGLNATHTQSDMLLSVIEGISFALYAIFQSMQEAGIEINKIIAGGGFTASAEWAALLASIFNMPVEIIDDADVSAKGAALFGLQTTGIKTNDFTPVINKIYEPDIQRHQQYLQYFHLYKKLYPLLRQTFFDLDQIRKTK